MRKIIILSFITLDGVMQAPGGPEEDNEGKFPFGGWSVNYWDDFLAKQMDEQMGHPFEMLLGRKTYNIFAASWPKMDPENSINQTKKYVVTHHPVPEDTENWKNSIRIDGDIVEKIRKLKNENGPEIQVHGSGNLIQTLLKNDLADEFRLKIYPVILGKGKRLFAEGTLPAAFKLNYSGVSPNGVIIANYIRAGEVRTGSF